MANINLEHAPAAQTAIRWQNEDRVIVAAVMARLQQRGGKTTQQDLLREAVRHLAKRLKCHPSDAELARALGELEALDKVAATAKRRKKAAAKRRRRAA